VACSGVHGANRLASNSLLEALVYGDRVARSVATALLEIPPRAHLRDVASMAFPSSGDPSGLSERQARLRQVMWDKTGLVRTGDGLRSALEGINDIARGIPAGAGELRSLVTVARLIARAALARPESRGAHFRSDHPQPDASWRRRLVLDRQNGRERLGFAPIPRESRDEVPA
jgi:L-aspartate oxidase